MPESTIRVPLKLREWPLTIKVAKWLKGQNKLSQVANDMIALGLMVNLMYLANKKAVNRKLSMSFEELTEYLGGSDLAACSIECGLLKEEDGGLVFSQSLTSSDGLNRTL